MNPIIVFVLFMLLYQEDNHFPNHFETFKLEQLLDKLNFAVSSLDRINHLNELAHEPLQKDNLAHTIEDSIHTVKPLLPEGKSQQQLDTFESVIESIKKIGGLQNMAQSLGPALKMLSSFPTSSTQENDVYDDNDYDYDYDYHHHDYDDYKNDDPYDIEKFKQKEDPFL